MSFHKRKLMYLQLNDTWDYAPDDTIAREVFAGLDSSVILPQPCESSQLCHRCISLRLLYANCTFMDSPAGLEEKANKERCALCRLISQGIQARAKGYRDFVRFASVGSYLTIDDGQGQAIANLYTMPGMCWMQSRFTLSPQLLTIDQVPKMLLCRTVRLGFPDYPMLVVRPSSRS